MTHNHFIKKNKNKNGIRCIIYIFKNYFVIIFLIFNKISCIQTEISKPPKKKKKKNERKGQTLRAFGGVWFIISNNNFQFLNNISRISTHFFTHTYFHKYFQKIGRAHV